MIEAVIDTNILVSALLNPNGSPGQILAKVISGNIVPCLDGRILAEYRIVLSRAKFGFRREDVDVLLSFFEREGFFVVPFRNEIPFQDESDRKVFEVAVSRGAVRVTGNRKHFPKNSLIVSPAELIKQLEDV